MFEGAKHSARNFFFRLIKRLEPDAPVFVMKQFQSVAHIQQVKQNKQQPLGKTRLMLYNIPNRATSGCGKSRGFYV